MWAPVADVSLTLGPPIEKSGDEFAAGAILGLVEDAVVEEEFDLTGQGGGNVELPGDEKIGVLVAHFVSRSLGCGEVL